MRSDADDMQCDEAQPTCSGCLDRRVQCQYSAEVSKFVHLHQPDLGQPSDLETIPLKPTYTPNGQVVLSIRSSREPPCGDGLYHTFVPLKLTAKERARQAKKAAAQRCASISPPPSSDTTKLQNEFGSVLHSASSAGLHLRILGKWLDMATQRVGSSPVLDRSIACLIAGHKAKFSFNEKAMRSGRQRYGEALTLLRDTVGEGVESVTADVIAATRMLMVFEIMVGTEVHGWISHSYGAINLFLAIGPEACRSEFERTLFYGVFAQAWQQGLMIGKLSVFDKPEWLNIAPPDSCALPRVRSQRRLYVFTRLPRLTCLVRAAREDPTDSILAEKAVELAEELLSLDWTRDQEWELRPRIVPTGRADDAELVPSSFEYSEEDFEAVVGLNLWWASKIMLSGLCQTLHSCGAPIKWPSLAELYEEERHCAMLIAMTVDYSSTLAPYGCVAMLMYMQIAWGVYWRQKDFAHSINGYGMIDWLLRRGNEFMEYFNGKSMTNEGLAFFTERLMGGPVLPPEFFNKDNKQLNDDQLQQVSMLRRMRDQRGTENAAVKLEVDSAFREGLRHVILGSEPKVDYESLYRSSYRNTVLDIEHLT